MLKTEITIANKVFCYLSQNRISPILLHGDNDSEMKEYALRLTASLLGEEGDEFMFSRIKKGNHPDLYQLSPQGKMNLFVMAELKGFVEESAMAPFESGVKVFIFYQAERMLPTHANILLKTLEESGEKVVIILITRRKRELLDTIISRCIQVPFRLEEDLIAEEEEIYLIAACFRFLFEEKFYELTEAVTKVVDHFKDPQRVYRLILLFFSERNRMTLQEKGLMFPIQLLTAKVNLIPLGKLMDLLTAADENHKLNIRFKHSLENLFLGLNNE